MTQSAQPVVSEIETAVVKYSPFFSEIRRRLIFTLSIFIIAAGVGFIYYEKIVSIILKIFAIEGINIVFTSPFQFFTLAVNSALLVGSIAILPALIFQALSFIRPALRAKEYKAIVTLLPIAILLFLFGFTYGVLIMKYVVMVFFQKSVELHIGNYIDVSLLLSQIMTTATLLGIAFQFPLVLTVLIRLRIIHPSMLSKQRLFVYVLSLLFAAILPPTDVLSLFLLFLPLALLFELTLLFNKYLHNK